MWPCMAHLATAHHSSPPPACRRYAERQANLQICSGFYLDESGLLPLVWMAATRDINLGEVIRGLEHILGSDVFP